MELVATLYAVGLILIAAVIVVAICWLLAAMNRPDPTEPGDF